MKFALVRLTFLLLISSMSFAQPLRVMSYNIRYDNPGDGLDAWPVRRTFLAEQIQKSDPDILGVQESLPHQVAWLAGALTAYSHLGVGRDENGTGESTTLFYRTNRFELQSSGMFWLSETPDQLSKGWDAAIRRICTWAVLKDKSTGKPVLVMNTHFDHVGVEARKQSASLLVTKSRELNKGQWPVILLGDFNSTPDSEAVKTLQSAFTDARLAAKSRTLPQEGSFNAFDFSRPAAQLIDHIFVWGGLDTERFVMLVESRERRYPSDHFPVVAELQLKPSPR